MKRTRKTPSPVAASRTRPRIKDVQPSGQEPDEMSALLRPFRSVDHTIALDAGFYLVALASLDLPATRVNGIELPLIHFRASDARGQPVAITRPEGVGPW